MVTGYPGYNLGNYADELDMDGAPDVTFDWQDALDQWAAGLNLEREMEEWVNQMLRDYGST